MIKVGITGADSRQAGELLRILVNHTDVDIMAAVAPHIAGRTVASFHHGLIGETSISFSASMNTEELDAVFLAPGSMPDEINRVKSDTNLRVIDFSQRSELDPDMVPAISEIYRKPMVRGARQAQVVNPLASLLLIAIYPLAANLLLNSDLNVKVVAPESTISNESLDIAATQTKQILSKIQRSFDRNISFQASASDRNRSTRLQMDVRCSLDIDEIDRLYDSIYDDHNFTFITHSPVGAQETSGTHKCIITLEKPDADTLRITSLGDCRLRGGAGDAMHAFNLLFGLHERTGLTLKAAKY